MSEAEIIPPPTLDDARDRAARNPFTGTQVTKLPVTGGALASVETNRAVAEVQARMMIARANPRDPLACMDAILNDCTRPSLAQHALYAYSRGGAAVTGPSIRLAEAIARRWGNIASGIKEIARGDGYSECVAYAWDLETGYYDERQFQVKHWRDTQKGGYALKDERDIYELVANLGQRRKRAVLLTVMPGDVIEAAEAQCEKTLNTNVDTSPEALKRLSDAFATLGVTRAMIEKRCQCRLEAIRPAQIVTLRKIYAALKDGMSAPEDWFGTGGTSAAWTEIEQRHAASAAEQQQAEKPARTTRPRATRAADPNPHEHAEAHSDQRTETPRNTVAPTATGPREAAAPQPPPEETPFGRSSGGGVPWIERWLNDENDNVVGEEPIKTAYAFASELETLWRASERPKALLENNRDGMEDAAKSDPQAAEIIASLEAAPNAEPADYVVPIPTTRDGKPNIGQYMRDFKAALDDVDAPEFNDWIAANMATVMGTAATTQPLLIKHMVDRANILGLPKPHVPAAPAAAAAQPAQPAQPPAQPADVTAIDEKDRRILNNILAELPRVADVPGVELWANSVVVTNPMKRWRSEEKFALVDEVLNAFGARRAELGGKPKPPGP